MNMRGISIRQIGQYRSDSNLFRALEEGIKPETPPALVIRRKRLLQRRQVLDEINDAVEGIMNLIGRKHG